MINVLNEKERKNALFLFFRLVMDTELDLFFGDMVCRRSSDEQNRSTETEWDAGGGGGGEAGGGEAGGGGESETRMNASVLKQDPDT